MSDLTPVIKGHMAAYLSNPKMSAKLHTPSCPTAPLDPGTVAFVKGKPAITQSVKDLCFYQRAFARLNARHNSEFYALAKEFMDSGVWKDQYKTRTAAIECVVKITADSYYKGISRIWLEPSTAICQENNSAVEIECLMDIEAARKQWKEAPKPTATSPKSSAKPADEVLENGERVSDYKPPRQAPTEHPDNGKPKHALAVWKDLYELYGKALNRIDEANRVSPNPERRDHMQKQTKGLMHDSQVWKEESK